MRLDCRTISPIELSEEEIHQMYSLMEKNYKGVAIDSFKKDLKSKDTVFLFSDQDRIQGFTGLQFKPYQFSNTEILIAYSGDTVLEQTYRGTLSIPVYWGRYMLSLSENNPSLFWLLTSKGFRTYRYLSVFFKEFIPMPSPPNEYLFHLREQIAKEFFGDSFDRTTGILDRKENNQAIMDPDSDWNAIRASKDPYIQFFEKANPNFDKGNELVCLAHFHQTNICNYILRILKNKSNV